MAESNTPMNMNIDPSLDEHLEKVVENMTSGEQPSRTFGDGVKVEKSDIETLPGETPTEAHIRLQNERMNPDKTK